MMTKLKIKFYFFQGLGGGGVECTFFQSCEGSVCITVSAIKRITYSDLQIKKEVSPASELEHGRHAWFLRMDLLSFHFARQYETLHF